MANSKDARQEAAQIIGRVLREGAYANRLLNATFQKAPWDPRDRALLTELVYGVLRHLYTLDHALDQVAQKGVRSIDPAILNHLRVAAYQLLYLDRVAEHAVLSQAVKYIRKQRGQRVGGFANALLRKIQKDPASLLRFDDIDEPAEMLSKMYSHPRWLVERWLERLGPERTQQRLASHNQGAPLTFRYHGPASQRDEVLAALAAQQLEAEPTRWSPYGIRLRGALHGSLHQLLETFPYPLVPQDEAAQLVVAWLEPQVHEDILDACAAPGGKTTHIHALAPQAHVTGCDVHPHKLDLIRKLYQRLEQASEDNPTASPYHYTLLAQDATQPFDATFDRILCDAPCSGLGVMRKQPEIRYRRGPEEIQELAQIQQRLLHNLAQALRPGGLLVFSVCTDTPEENEQVVNAFLNQHPEFSVDKDIPADLPGRDLMDQDGYLRTSPEMHDMDAFFAVRLRKGS